MAKSARREQLVTNNPKSQSCPNKVNLRLSQERDSLTFQITVFIGVAARAAPAHCCCKNMGQEGGQVTQTQY